MARRRPTTAITAVEQLYGVARLPEGRRREALSEAIRGLVEEDLDGRVEPFDATAASHLADVVSARAEAGRPISVADAQRAAICRALEATLVTRNTGDFIATGIDLLNPWPI